ncbi:hypothetical protein [Capnocytophaga sp. oral taxon 332]|uniref:hypothetical protein n=1 Tax=Capnocytophaga sp. oral taxon 332 TaxID=712213 RepID=UPI001E299770|nr:hypothetical protein [Capnocytophaga sp. oral taxon 332]
MPRKTDKTLKENYSTHKNKHIILRVSESQKQHWKKLCAERKITLTDLLTSAVEGKMSSQEQREVLKFIEKQDNIFAKIENNINQFAYLANAKKEVYRDELIAFTERLDQIVKLKAEQNKIFIQIYKLIAANDSQNTKLSKQRLSRGEVQRQED